MVAYNFECEVYWVVNVDIGIFGGQGGQCKHQLGTVGSWWCLYYHHPQFQTQMKY